SSSASSTAVTSTASSTSSASPASPATTTARAAKEAYWTMNRPGRTPHQGEYPITVYIPGGVVHPVEPAVFGPGVFQGSPGRVCGGVGRVCETPDHFPFFIDGPVNGVVVPVGPQQSSCQRGFFEVLADRKRVAS